MHVEPKAVILMYHRVASTDTDPWGMCVSPRNFAAQLGVMNTVATPLSLADFVHRREQGQLPERSVVVTFDDGYVDNFTSALPLLRQHGVPSTLFVSTSHIDTEAEFWWDRLESMLLKPASLPERLELSIHRQSLAWELGDAADYSRALARADSGLFPWSAPANSRLGFFYEVWKTLWPLGATHRDRVLEQIAQWSEFTSGLEPPRRTLNSDEIRHIAAEGLMSIGAHSEDHPPLSAHPTQEQSRQIVSCQQRLQGILGAPVTTFAYPHGKYNQETIDVLVSAGFDCAVTVEHKVAGTHSDPMRLPRFGVKDMPAELFTSQLQQWFELPAPSAPRVVAAS